MRIGDLVKLNVWGVTYGIIMGFELWDDEDGSFEMVEVLADNGYPTFLPRDEMEVISESRRLG